MLPFHPACLEHHNLSKKCGGQVITVSNSGTNMDVVVDAAVVDSVPFESPNKDIPLTVGLNEIYGMYMELRKQNEHLVVEIMALKEQNILILDALNSIKRNQPVRDVPKGANRPTSNVGGDPLPLERCRRRATAAVTVSSNAEFEGSGRPGPTISHAQVDNEAHAEKNSDDDGRVVEINSNQAAIAKELTGKNAQPGVSSSTTDAKATKGNKEVAEINLEMGQVIEHDKDEWTLVRNKTRRNSDFRPQRKKVIGERNPENSSGLKAVDRRAHLHICKLQPDTSEDDVRNHLSTIGAADYTVKQLEPKFPQFYSSFHVSIPLGSLDQINNASAWPKGTILSRYHFFRKQIKPEEPPLHSRT